MRLKPIAAIVLAATALLPAAAEAKPAKQLEIKTVSNRADLISGRDALVVVRLRVGVRPAKVPPAPSPARGSRPTCRSAA